MYQFALRCLVCIWICGSFGISSAISWGLDLPTSLRIHMPEYLLLAFSGASGHMSLLTELRKSGRVSGYLLLNVWPSRGSVDGHLQCTGLSICTSSCYLCMWRRAREVSKEEGHAGRCGRPQMEWGVHLAQETKERTVNVCAVDRRTLCVLGGLAIKDPFVVSWGLWGGQKWGRWASAPGAESSVEEVDKRPSSEWWRESAFRPPGQWLHTWAAVCLSGGVIMW